MTVVYTKAWLDAHIASLVAASLGADSTPAAAAAAQVATVLAASGIPTPAVAATNLVPDPRLNTPGNWTVANATADWSGDTSVILAATGSPTSFYLYEKSANAHVVTAGEKVSVGVTYEGLANIVGNVYVFIMFWAAAGPSTQNAPILTDGTNGPLLSASVRNTYLNRVVPAGADRMTIQVGIRNVTGSGTQVRIKDINVRKLAAAGTTLTAADVDPLDGTMSYCRWTGTVDNSTTEQLDRLVANSELRTRYGAASVNDRLAQWAATSGAVEYTAITATDSDNIPTAANVVWPDGSTGVYALVSKYVGGGVVAINSYTMTHAVSGKTVTQPAPTRDAAGNVTVLPAPTVA